MRLTPNINQNLEQIKGLVAFMQELEKRFQTLDENLEQIIENQNQLMHALSVTYKALEAVAAKTGTKLPKPTIDMGYHEED